MAFTTTQPISLNTFSQSPSIDESPAWELLNGQAIQKPMPTFYHSRLQKRLINAIDAADSPYEAFPELRCILSQNSVVPDITVIHNDRLPDSNRPVQGAPNWLIEILSPDQSTTKLITKIQLCLTEGSQLGWLIDSDERIIMTFLPDRSLRLFQNDAVLPVLDSISLELTPTEIFSWLP
jgi:Uma2 family endonuclease